MGDDLDSGFFDDLDDPDHYRGRKEDRREVVIAAAITSLVTTLVTSFVGSALGLFDEWEFWLGLYAAAATGAVVGIGERAFRAQLLVRRSGRRAVSAGADAHRAEEELREEQGAKRAVDKLVNLGEVDVWFVGALPPPTLRFVERMARARRIELGLDDPPR